MTFYNDEGMISLYILTINVFGGQCSISFVV